MTVKANDKYTPNCVEALTVNGLKFRSKNQACFYYSVSWSAVASRMKRGESLETAIIALRARKGLNMLNSSHMALICSKSWGCDESTILAKLTQGRRV
jgi:hypothetical protein